MRSNELAEVHELDEGSWIYLSLGEGSSDSEVGHDLRRRVIEACEASGWPAVSWSPLLNERHDSKRFLEGMSHAIERADVVVVLADEVSPMIDTEFAFAVEHKRPVVGLRFEGMGGTGSRDRRLDDYGRARLVNCVDVDGCAAALRQALTDPAFSATIHEAALEDAANHV